jgi:hypothetical protein
MVKVAHSYDNVHFRQHAITVTYFQNILKFQTPTENVAKFILHFLLRMAIRYKFLKPTYNVMNHPA